MKGLQRKDTPEIRRGSFSSIEQITFRHVWGNDPRVGKEILKNIIGNSDQIPHRARNSAQFSSRKEGRLHNS